MIQAETTFATADPNSYSEVIWNNTSASAQPLNYLVVPSDDAGSTPLVSDHGGVTAGADLADPTRMQPLDAIDWYGYWRPTEGALAEAFGDPFAGYSAFCSDAGAACDPLRDMGTFESGAQVTQIRNAGDLPELDP